MLKIVRRQRGAAHVDGILCRSAGVTRSSVHVNPSNATASCTPDVRLRWVIAASIEMRDALVAAWKAPRFNREQEKERKLTHFPSSLSLSLSLSLSPSVAGGA